ncbi:MAG TPA: LCP family protein [Nocardioides sp.]|jgi:LCP family protein required for cell wall assembly|uniref:LCP family protein n=1 Tax=Nocardioides sp. TaxID=35761 RepID=UPI002E300A37|nr:LCP family protein [Nocardioides sp.]HEX3929213.1 LCP family protein [Nocardioides sp.]
MSDDWLYGGAPRGQGGDRPDQVRPDSSDPDATRPVPRSANPDETRVMPTVPRPGGSSAPPPPPSARSPRPTPPPPSRPTPPGGSSSGPGRTFGRFRRPRLKLRYLWLIVVLWLVYLVAVPFFAWSKADKIDAFPSGHRPADQPGTNYLLVGSDSRAGLSAAQRKKLHTGDASGQRTDTIVVIHTGSGPTLTMSIPRDSLVPIPGHGTTKINAAFAYGGPKLLIQTIEQDTGIHIDHYVEIGLGGFVNIVDSVGGITICPSHTMNDKLANLHVKKGCQHAGGTVALAYARSRHADPKLGDIARGGQQREVMKAVGHKALSPWTVLNPFRYWNLWTSATDNLTVDKDMSAVAMGHFGWAMTHSKLTCPVPISNLAVTWDPTRSKQMFHDIITDHTAAIGKGLCTTSGLPHS